MGPGTESAHEVPFLCSPAAHRQPCCLVEGRHWGDRVQVPRVPQTFVVEGPFATLPHQKKPACFSTFVEAGRFALDSFPPSLPSSEIFIHSLHPWGLRRCDADHPACRAKTPEILQSFHASGTESTGQGAEQITFCVTPGPYRLKRWCAARPITIKSACSLCACITICSAALPASTANSGLHHFSVCAGSIAAISFSAKFNTPERSG